MASEIEKTGQTEEETDRRTLPGLQDKKKSRLPEMKDSQAANNSTIHNLFSQVSPANIGLTLGASFVLCLCLQGFRDTWHLVINQQQPPLSVFH